MNPVSKLFILGLVAYAYAAPGIEHRAEDASTAVLNEESSSSNQFQQGDKLRECVQQQVTNGQSQLSSNQNDMSSSSSYQNYNMEELRKQFQKCGGDQAAFNSFANSFGSFPNFPGTGSSSASSSK